MPVYEYRCTSCEREFEYQQRMSDPPKDVCEACSGKLERIISRTAFQLKGGGWYKDLYASSKPDSGSASSGSSTSSASPSTSSGSSDAGSSSAASSPAPSSGSSGSSGSSSGSSS